jgi:saccharopine dehydrogenase-like NADP-dependent oxidoreductase
MSYSKTHQNFANRLNKPEALTEPQNFLGPNYETVLNFWKWIDSLKQDQWQTVTDRYHNLDPAARNAARDAAWNAAGNAAGAAAGEAAWFAARGTAGIATWELMGMHILLDQGKKLVFVPLFDSL